jgi:hypothetical protein
MQGLRRSIPLIHIALLIVLVTSLSAVSGCGPENEELSASSLQPMTVRGGPVILGGDDLTLHGYYSLGAPQGGWIYIQKAQESLKAQVTRPNDGSIAILGAASSTNKSSDAGGAYYYTAPLAGLRPEFYDGILALENFFDGLRAGTKRPAILVMAGTLANNDIDSYEGPALSNNAVTIADFVNSGGGLLAHGSGSLAYGWLSTLIPGIVESSGCNYTTLSLTPEGQAAFPGLTNTHLRAGHCHSHFSGDLGGLKVLARDGSGWNIFLGGATVQLPGSISLTPQSATYVIGSTSSHQVTAKTRNGLAKPVVGATITFAVISGPNQGRTGTAVTNSLGEASFTYSSNGNPGTDLITASFVDASGNTQTSASVEAIWSKPPNRPPVAKAGGPYTTPEGSSATLDGSGSSDPEGDSLTYAWDLDNDGSYDDATGPTASFSGVDGPRDHSVGLKVCDDAGTCATGTATVQVTNVAPVANAGADRTVYRKDSVSISGTWSDPAGSGDNSYTWAWDLNGDGVFDVSGQAPYGTLVARSTSFAEAGTYTLKFQVKDKDWASHTDTVVITVVNRPPVAKAGGPYTIPEGSSVTLSGSGSSDPEGDSLTYAWDLDNDGSYDDATGPTASFSGVDGPRSHPVGLRVCDARDCAIGTATVQVTNVAPVANAGEAQTIYRYAPVSVSGTWSDPAGSADNSYTWAWDLNGDGVFDVSGQAPYGTPVAQTTSFAMEGTYTLKFQVTDKDGASHTGTVVITVVNRPPVAKAGGPYTTLEGSSVTLDGIGSSDPDGDSLTYAWDLDNDGSHDDATGPTVSFSGVDGPRGHSVGLKVCDARECVTGTATVQVTNVAPVANAGADQTVYPKGSVNVSGTWSDPAGSADNAYTWAWDLNGDGTFDASGQAQYGTPMARSTSFAVAGTYTLKFQVTDKDGASHTDTVVITVVNRPPVAKAGGPYTTPEGSSITLNGNGSSDPDGDSLTYAWDLDNDGSYGDATGTTASFSSVDGPRVHPVGLRVCDEAGACATGTATVQVTNVAPMANAGADQIISRKGSVSVSGTWSDPAGSADNAYTWAWDLNGDGTFDVSGQAPHGTPVARSTSFAAVGTYTLKFQVTDKDGASHTDTVVITVVNRSPVAKAGGPYTTPEGSSVTLDGSGSSDPDGDSLTYAWDLDNDGSHDDATGPTASFSGVDGPRDHSVGLKVCDETRACATSMATVQVTNVAPVANAGADRTVYPKGSVSVSGTWSDPAGSADNSYTWAWDLNGDGTFDVSGQAQYGTPVTRSTSFAAAGTYTLKFQVTDKDGASHTDTVVITVVNHPPDCSTAAPSIGLIWPPNHQMVAVSVQGVTDAENDPLVISITSIHQDEPVNDIADGNTDVDGTGVGTSTAMVRAERSGSKKNPGNGRVYHIGFTVDDGRGGSCSGVVNVGVPHDQGGQHLPINDGPLYDSTRP